MGLNKQSGNMYTFVTHTWNPMRGKCPHDCSYCSIKDIQKRYGYDIGNLRLVEKELLTDLGEGNYIFVGSSTDMWASNVPEEWIHAVLKLCKEYPKNTYLFQTKNPLKFYDFINSFPKNTVLCSTIETNRFTDKISNAPLPSERSDCMEKLPRKFTVSITIEPILDFDVDEMVDMMTKIKPDFISIGADSKGHNLPEPSSEKIKQLIGELEKFTIVKVKSNLSRLLTPTDVSGRLKRRR